MSKWPKINLKSRWGRFNLVPPTHEDDADAAAMMSDPLALKYFPLGPKSTTAEEWREIREKHAKDDERWVFHIHLAAPSTKSRLVGQCGIIRINPVNRQADIGIIVSPQQNRTGIATEALFLLLSHAFEHPELKLHKVSFVTAMQNVPMRSWLEKFGVGVEYRLRDAWSDGEGWVDAMGYTILENEWPDVKMRLEKWLDTNVKT